MDLLKFSCRTVAFVALAVLIVASHSADGATCNSAILQLEPYPDNDIYYYSPTSYCYPTTYLTINSMKGLCNVAIKVDVDLSGVIRMIPLSQDSVNYTYPGPSSINFIDCKDLNASGLFNAGSTTAATVMLFDDKGGPLTTVNVSYPGRITINPGHTYGYRGPGPICPFNYTVVSGCFMGISGTRPSVLTCPKNYAVTTGRLNTKYCAPCKPGTSSPGGTATKCTPCPPGTYNQNYAGRCRPCDKGYYSAYPGPAGGFTGCAFCNDGQPPNKWTNGKTCNQCPANSWVSGSNPAQCVRCSKGVKCCTVNWDANCPKCTSDKVDYTTYNSVFGLSSGSSATCLQSRYALCSPKFNVTIDQTCNMVVAGMPPKDPYLYCDWQVTVPIIGSKPNPVVDMAVFKDYYWSDSYLPAGNVTKAYGPYLNFYLPTPKCTLTYRALSKPAAALLGVPPAVCPEGTKGCTYRPPSSAALCPAGTFIEEETDTKPAPCHPCPPGTYQPKPSAKGCLPCPAGYSAAGYGNTKCTLCPQETPLADPGAAACRACEWNAVGSGVNKCTACPTNTGRYYSQYKSCLGIDRGTTCCAAGDCKDQPACPKNLQYSDWDYTTGAIFQLTGTNDLQQSFCSKATLLTCLSTGAYIAFAPQGQSGFQLMPLQQKRCLQGSYDNYRYALNLYGGFSSSKRAAGSIYYYNPYTSQGGSAGYELYSDKAAKTLTIYLSKNDDASGSIGRNTTTCSATFKLVAGYAFDLAPPAGAKCPSNTIPTTVGGRQFCKFCGTGQFKNGTQCSSCATGYYQPFYGGGQCEICPAGATCYSGSSWPSPCYSGYNPKPGGGECLPCGENRYAFPFPGATKCLACPKGTIAPAGSSACGVPWLKKF